MGYICVVPQFVENSKKLTSNEVLSDKATFDTITKTENYLPCFHDPAFVQQQLYVSFIIWASFLFFSILWVVASNQQNRSLKNDEVGFSLALRQWARKDRIAIIINRPVQLVASLGIFVILVNRCNYLSVDVAEYYIGLALYLAAFVDTLVRFCAAKQKISYAFSPYTILDIFSLASYFCVGFAPSLLINGTAARTWLDFSIMRSIFIYRSFMEMDSHFDTSTRGIMLFRLAVRCFLLLMWAASVMFFVEMTGEINAFVDNGFAHLYSCPNGTISSASSDGACGSETWSMMFALYFTVVTLGTVGYGDNSAHYLPSRLLVMVFILAGIILFSMEIQNMVNLYQLRKIGNPPYRPKSRTTQHVVIMGNPTYPQLSATLRELFHPDHFQGIDRTFLHAVVLGDSSSKYVKGLIQRLESEPKFASTVTFVAGDPTDDADLDRVRLKDAIGAFFIPDKLASDAVKEDARNIMHILSAKQYAGYDFPCWAIALRNDNIRHMLAAGVDRDGIVCEETMKMGVMARSCACPGYATFLSNLASCLSLAKQPDSPFALRSKAALGGDLNAAPCVAAAAAQPWMNHYYAGASREFYVVSLSKEFADMTFRDVAAQIFTRSKGSVVLIAVEVVVDDPSESDAMAARIHGVRVMLNPGHAMRLKEGSSVYVIADDLASVQAFHITNDDVADDEDDVVHSPRPSTGRQSTLRTPLLPSSSSMLPSTTHPAKAPVPPPRRFRVSSTSPAGFYSTSHSLSLSLDFAQWRKHALGFHVGSGGVVDSIADATPGPDRGPSSGVVDGRVFIRVARPRAAAGADAAAHVRVGRPAAHRRVQFLGGRVVGGAPVVHLAPSRGVFAQHAADHHLGRVAAVGGLGVGHRQVFRCLLCMRKSVGVPRAAACRRQVGAFGAGAGQEVQGHQYRRRGRTDANQLDGRRRHLHDPAGGPQDEPESHVHAHGTHRRIQFQTPQQAVPRPATWRTPQRWLDG
ncbi:hypothetical protein, variant 6 [Aphanomyces astaci]|uniref:Potassium channel domain-containing protein n=1 Tax=Aphanomyces astaci TaxID=112090 RepID=W4GPH6_APHAT|nr:hypothetical protein, variant 4 [Aphanomyces astaci]XP_009829728.1 hypothetical protein, variant 5 [Aphanomyces astaci]XP_009829729.1 hypothetical protein, variant 6 [Aphanomyces astaci]ETV80782.1 hypothetical protein, variant 4 [Aphanomyces astaci]ETV80783.1 hypothetical protein, variant 5 [Aphanomyces astaci]ETV80784.1 hypothetical protein, variant 6 [Aphanomyces astaci]|eukprot:XP_009829727.1 hypothetical protein, variant 4 [Aphanomyces astaci]